MSKIARLFYKLIRPKRKGLMLLRFVKENGRWYIDLPAYPGPKAALEMVAGADDFCDMLSSNGREVVIKCADRPFGGAQYQLSLFAENPGGTYKVTALSQGTHSKLFEPFNVWLCDVTVYVFGRIPETIYVRNIIREV